MTDWKKHWVGKEDLLAMLGKPESFSEKKEEDQPYPKKDGMTQVDDNIYLK